MSLQANVEAFMGMLKKGQFLDTFEGQGGTQNSIPVRQDIRFPFRKKV
jgi:hypothetical protein